GATYVGAGENIALGQPTPAQVMKSWMTSPGHRANILGPFTHLGTGYVPCGTGAFAKPYWTQDFLKKK
ncbi:MAG: transporter, partial [Deltaproteobacteria bacterium]|nr:transporter [Deltaproteobacteria bacterium]